MSLVLTMPRKLMPTLDGNSFHQYNVNLLFSYLFFLLYFFSESRDIVEQLFLSKGQ